MMDNVQNCDKFVSYKYILQFNPQIIFLTLLLAIRITQIL
jgi:hypothetical protein